MKNQSQLLLLEDIQNLGRKGDIVKAKPGFARNFLLPQAKAVIADKRTLRMQEKLKQEREQQAKKDKEEALKLAKVLKDKVLSISVKSDTQGHLYGSVSSLDIMHLLEKEEGVKVERRSIILSKPIKTNGVYDIALKLKEDVPATIKLKVIGDGFIESEAKEKEPAEDTATQEDEEQENIPSSKEIEDSNQEEIENRTKN